MADVALFRDATEMLFTMADTRRRTDPAAPPVPRRIFVKDADEAHRFALDGTYPLVGMSLDDLLVCARMDHPNAAKLVAIAGVHRGFLDLMGRPGITDIAGLKGKRVAVDTDTGYARALFEILRRNGLAAGRDYEVVYAGATNLRFEKLLAGDFDATLLGAPFTRLALAGGFRSLGTVIAALGGYQAVVLVAQTPWLAQNLAAARSVTAALYGALAWARDPANAAAVGTALHAALPPCDAATAAAVTTDLFGPTSEFLADGRMQPQDTEVVLRLFNAAGGTALTPADLAHMTDLRFLP
ncbi:MAG: hypothetical protein B7Z15_01025 [Rhizobiales bacterium 32-66-8]|nr:MAG: hypothetical protein B7Z15_01025 [Rhizobiales bacterium 32-66-8]